MEEPRQLELAPLLARRELWLLLSAAYTDPYYGGRTRLLGDGDFRRTARAGWAVLQEEARDRGWEEEARLLRSTGPGRLFSAFDAREEDLAETYRLLFGATLAPGRSPCALEWEMSPDVTYRAQALADILGFYHAFGLQPSGRSAERPDHITLVAEFLYVLLTKEAAAREAGSEEKSEICHRARGAFFKEHVGWWLPAFARSLAASAPEGFYRYLARLTEALPRWSAAVWASPR